MKRTFYNVLGALLLACGGVNAQTVDLSAGLIMHLALNGNANDSTIFGNSGTRHGIITPTTDEAGTPNSAMLFTNSAYISVPSNDSLNSENFSICAKVYPMGFYNGQYYLNSIASKGDYYWIPGQYCLQFDALYEEVAPESQVRYAAGSLKDTVNETYTGYCYGAYPQASYFNYSPKVRLNNWSSLVLTANTDSIKFYLNGSLMYAFERYDAKGTNTYDLRLAMHGDPSYPYTFTGKMDEVRFYTRALNDKEVAAYSKPVTTGIREVSSNIAGLNISPNPATEKLQLNFDALVSGKLGVSIIDMTGRTVQSEQRTEQKGHNAVTLQTGQLASGNYLVKLTDENGHSVQLPFTKQ